LQNIHRKCSLKITKLFLKHDELYKAIIKFEYVGVDEHAENVADHLSMSGSQYIADGLYASYAYDESSSQWRTIQEKIDRSRDWRWVVNRYVKGLPADTKAWLSRTRIT
jgi:hypothetical protein